MFLPLLISVQLIIQSAVASNSSTVIDFFEAVKRGNYENFYPESSKREIKYSWEEYEKSALLIAPTGSSENEAVSALTWNFVREQYDFGDYTNAILELTDKYDEESSSLAEFDVNETLQRKLVGNLCPKPLLTLSELRDFQKVVTTYSSAKREGTLNSWRLFIFSCMFKQSFYSSLFYAYTLHDDFSDSEASECAKEIRRIAECQEYVLKYRVGIVGNEMEHLLLSALGAATTMREHYTPLIYVVNQPKFLLSTLQGLAGYDDEFINLMIRILLGKIFQQMVPGTDGDADGVWMPNVKLEVLFKLVATLVDSQFSVTKPDTLTKNLISLAKQYTPEQVFTMVSCGNLFKSIHQLVHYYFSLRPVSVPRSWMGMVVEGLVEGYNYSDDVLVEGLKAVGRDFDLLEVVDDDSLVRLTDLIFGEDELSHLRTFCIRPSKVIYLLCNCKRAVSILRYIVKQRPEHLKRILVAYLFSDIAWPAAVKTEIEQSQLVPIPAEHVPLNTNITSIPSRAIDWLQTNKFKIVSYILTHPEYVSVEQLKHFLKLSKYDDNQVEGAEENRKTIKKLIGAIVDMDGQLKKLEINECSSSKTIQNAVDC